MKVDSVSLRNFRNIEFTEFQPSPGINFLLGKNAQGKTSVLEALSYLSNLRSFRTHRAQEAIQHDQTQAQISCGLLTVDPSDTEWRSQLEVQFDLMPTQRVSKTAMINGKAYKSASAYLKGRFSHAGQGFHTIVFNPSDHGLISGSPSERRVYLNQVIAGENVEYMQCVKKYQRILEQKNKLLKQMALSQSPNQTLLEGFNEQLILEGSFIIQARLDWLERLVKPLQKAMNKIAPEQQKISLQYAVNALENKELGPLYFSGQGDRVSLEQIKLGYRERLESHAFAELRAQTTLVGPHRDDWVFFLGPQPLKGHGSQGEVRSALLALKLSEIELFRKRTQLQPVLLLDDFSSELDQERRQFLFDYILETDLQVFVTTTEDVSFEGKKFRVLEGKVDVH